MTWLGVFRRDQAILQPCHQNLHRLVFWGPCLLFRVLQCVQWRRVRAAARHKAEWRVHVQSQRRDALHGQHSEWERGKHARPGVLLHRQPGLWHVQGNCASGAVLVLTACTLRLLQPIYILEKVVAPQQASYHTKIADYSSRRLSQASGSSTPVAVVMLVLEFKPLNPDPSTFDVPAFCGCSSQ